MAGTIIYPGTFDPITHGHTDIAARAARIFDRVIIGVAASSAKNTAFSPDERVDLARKVLAQHKNVTVTRYDGLLADFCRREKATGVLRGLRAVSDFEYEFQLAGMNRKLMPEVDTFFLTPSEQYMFISSSLVREIAMLGGNVAEFVDPIVLQALHGRLRKQ
ncbi:MAG: pantetheine-phosphate adenylyltransferase [Gammaproteobacteria bacterium]